MLEILIGFFMKLSILGKKTNVKNYKLLKNVNKKGVFFFVCSLSSEQVLKYVKLLEIPFHF